MVYSSYTTMSVALFSILPRSLGECRRIAVTPETRTSVIYLALILRELGLRAKLVPSKSRDYWELLGEGDCSLLIGDQALRATASPRARLVGDLGELVRDFLGIRPVYAATASPNICPEPIAYPPWPTPSFLDVLNTFRRTGLDLPLSALYHYHFIRLDYNASALSQSISLIRDFIEDTHPSSYMDIVGGERLIEHY